MKRIILLIFINFIFINFAFAKINRIEMMEAKCNSNEICEIGSGDNEYESTIDAKNQLRISIENNINDYLNNNRIFINIKMKDEKTKDLFSFIEVKKTKKYDDKFYSLAFINKQKAINGIKNEIGKIDNKMFVLQQNKSRKNLQKLKNYYFVRRTLNDEYYFLTGQKIPDVIQDNILNVKIFDNNKNYKYFVVNNTEYENLGTSLKDILKDNVKMATSQEKADRVVYVFSKMYEEKLFDVSFIKRKVIIRFDCYEDGLMINSIQYSFESTGNDEEVL